MKIKIAVLLVLLIANVRLVYGAGFGLIEQSASMGNAFAGGAATAEDASTVYFNPAGMMYLSDDQLLTGLHAARPSANFDNEGSIGSNSTGGLATPGGNGGDGGGWAAIPNIYLVKELKSNIKLGVGISPLFGLKTEYDKDWVGRYQAIKSDLKTININPAIAFKLNDQLSLGLGFSAMYSDAELTNAVDFGTLLGVPALFQRRDGLATIKGKDWGWGWNFGGIFQFNEATRIGLAYRSAIHSRLDGKVSFANVLSALSALPNFSNGDVKAKFVTPENISLAFLHHLNEKWALTGDIVWTRWSRFKELYVVRDTGVSVANVPQNWDNVVRVALGASYKYNKDMKFRVGIAYDESPVPNDYRTPRIPDSDRIWLSLGLNYKIDSTSSFDIAYTHIFFKDSSLNKVTDTTTPVLRDTLRGDYDNYAAILSAQYNYNF